MRMNEGKQFFVNRITLPRQHDDARHRHPARDAGLRGRRLQHRGAQGQRPPANQLGYFKPLEGKPEARSTSTPTPGADNKVDVKLKFEEQNRNQLSFGAGVSQFDGFFGQLSFQTVELPRPRRDRRRLAAAGLAGAAVPGLVQRAVPLRPADHGRRRRLHAGSTSSRSSTRRRRRARTSFSACRSPTTRGCFTGYSYEEVERLRHQPGVPGAAARWLEPVPARLAAARPGRPPHRQQDLAERRLQHRQPADFPDRRASGSRPASTSAGLGGNTNFYQTAAEGIWYMPVHADAHVARPARAKRSTSGRTATRRRCRSSRSSSSAASTAFAASTSAASGRAIRSRAS